MIRISEIVPKYEMKVRGVIHIGAHHGQEYNDYVKLGIENMIFFEPIKSNYETLIRRIGQQKSFNLALGNESGEKEMFVETENKGMSCSLLEPGSHLTKYPHIKFNKREIVRIEKLDNIDFVHSMYNFINIDVQGYELEVFKGATASLEFIDYIMAEINFEDVYKGCAHVEQVDEFLGSYGFVRVLTDSSPKTWGEALYIKY